MPKILQMTQIGAEIADSDVEVLAQLSSGSLSQGLYLEEEKLIESETEDKGDDSKDSAATSVA